MRFQIRHVTTYRYDSPVILGRHLFRLHPRENELLSLHSFTLSIYPPPADLSSSDDGEGNRIHAAGFEGKTQEFRVAVHSEGETHVRMPSFMPTPVNPASYLVSCPDPDMEIVSDFATGIDEAGGGDALSFLNLLNQRIHRQLQTTSRLTGEPLSPSETLREGRGSCRDFAVLFIACCRWREIPARFVSGYFPAHPGDRQHMHAWTEACLPGLGWLGFDPTQGGEVGERHIAVAAALKPALATPISGFYTGPARSEMNIELSMNILDGAPTSTGSPLAADAHF